MADFSGLIGLSEPQLQARLGRPTSRRESGMDVWSVFAPANLTCRVRFRDEGDGARCASWTASFAHGYRTLAEAASAIGMWPAAEPDQPADSTRTPLVRRSLRCSDGSTVHSLTATVRNGRFTHISVFDEAPDWA